MILLSTVPFAPILFMPVIADDQLAPLLACIKRTTGQLSKCFSMAQTCELTGDTACREQGQNAEGHPRVYTSFDHDRQSLSLMERSHMPEFPALGRLIWEQMNVIFNASSIASFVTTQLYTNIALLVNREQWIGPAAHIFILSCGAIKLIFEVLASERPFTWQIALAFVLDFAKMMIHVTRSITLASYRAVALTALVTYLITLKVVENASHRDLLTGPSV